MRNSKAVRKRAKSGTAARAIYVAGADEIPKIEVTILLDTGEKVIYTFSAKDAGVLIEQMMAAYNAILPPLKTSRGGFGL